MIVRAYRLKSKKLKEQFIPDQKPSISVRKLDQDELTKDMIQELSEFLYKNLDKFGDDKASILACLAYLADPEKGGAFYAAFEGDKLAGGTAILKTHMSLFLPENFLVYIAVDPTYRGQGIGKKILDFAKADLDGGIALHVEPENPAKRLYEREGFTNKYLEMRYQP